MSLIRIDTEKCNKDGICAAVCPVELIRLDGEGFPGEIPEAEQDCIACGHCVAVCPVQALSHSKVAGCIPIREEKELKAESVEEFLKMRRSVREFKSGRVPRETLARAIDTARWAPSAVNIQPVRWLVVEDPENTKTLAGLIAAWVKRSLTGRYRRFSDAWEKGRDIILRGAPHVIVAYAPEENPWSPADSAIAVTYLELAAKAAGLGTCWSGLLVKAAEYDKAITEYLGIPAGHKIFGAVMIGAPKFHYPRIPEKNPAAIRWM